MGNLKKGDLEKIYTPKSLTIWMLDLLKKHYKEEITEFLEPSAGDGAIIDVLKKEYSNIPILAYDIYNETNRDDIIEQDFFKVKLEYKKGRVTIMNPPFNKAGRFIKKAAEFSDYVVTIASTNTFLNLDYNVFDVDKIDIFKKYEFNNNKKYPICVIALKK